jgi:hypothetical protein
MQDAALHEFNKDLMKRLLQQQIEAQIARAQAASALKERDHAVREAAERVEALRTVNAALIGSLRPFGLDRKKFVARIRASAQAIPNEGPQAARHALLHAETTRFLAEIGKGRGARA